MNILKVPPMQLILGWFGYVKVTKEAVLLSMVIEDFIKKLSEYSEGDDPFKYQLKIQKSITEFLRAGRRVWMERGK